MGTSPVAKLRQNFENLKNALKEKKLNVFEENFGGREEHIPSQYKEYDYHRSEVLADYIRNYRIKFTGINIVGNFEIGFSFYYDGFDEEERKVVCRVKYNNDYTYSGSYKIEQFKELIKYLNKKIKEEVFKDYQDLLSFFVKELIDKNPSKKVELEETLEQFWEKKEQERALIIKDCNEKSKDFEKSQKSYYTSLHKTSAYKKVQKLREELKNAINVLEDKEAELKKKYEIEEKSKAKKEAEKKHVEFEKDATYQAKILRKKGI